jgi:hypothetical protein
MQSVDAIIAIGLTLGLAGACDSTDKVAEPSPSVNMAGARANGSQSSGKSMRAEPSNPNEMGTAGAGGASAAGMKPADDDSSSQPVKRMPEMSNSSASTCDMTGRWLATAHLVTDGLGNLQTNHYWYYYELEQSGDDVTVKHSLVCGRETIGGGAFAITVDFNAGWSMFVNKLTHDGRAGKSVTVAGGCQISFERLYEVLGATLPHYLDPTTVLPTAEQEASGSMPGWEDWDSDGHPGVTGNISGTLSGKIFVAPRSWTAFSGRASDTQSLIKLSVEWDNEPNVMAYDGSDFLSATALPSGDKTMHFVELARLADDQATGDDGAVCKSIVTLAPTLTPTAAGM